tara:strand:+ start:1230 stop:2186 length:957 start_codon:yes stop_codon:yes gene_type:complete
MNVVFFASDGFDYSTSQMVEGLHLLSKNGEVNLKSTQSNPHHGAQVGDLTAVSDEEALDNIGWADILIFSSGGNMTCWSPKVEGAFEDPAHCKKRVFLDGHDGDGLLTPNGYTLLYFKREMRMPQCHRSATWHNVRSMPFGVYKFLLDGLDKDYDHEWLKRTTDVSFIAFGGSNPIRQECSKYLQSSDWDGMDVNVMAPDDRQPLEIDEYRAAMRSTKVGVSVHGAGLDTLRFWETPGFGAVLASSDITPNLWMRDAPEGHRHCIYFDSWNHLREHVRSVVCNKDRWMQMRRASDKWLTRNSTQSRARHLLEMCEEAL